MKKKFISILLSAVIALGSVQQVYGFDTKYTVTTNGSYTFIVRDKAGNETTLVITVDNIDTIKPTVDTLEFRPAEAVGNTPGISGGAIEIVIQASDNLSGVKNIEYQITGKNGVAHPAEWSTYDSSNMPTIIDNGEYSVHARCTDNVGNVSDIKTENVMVDTVVPVVETQLLN